MTSTDQKFPDVDDMKKKLAERLEVRNKDLWIELDLLNSEYEISWNWVKAHSTDKLNNEVDLLARNAANL